MELVTTSIGVAAVAYGAYTGYLRMANPAKLGKLEAMRKFMGAQTGGIVHFVAYTILPVAAGIAFIFAGLNGVKVF